MFYNLTWCEHKYILKKSQQWSENFIEEKRGQLLLILNSLKIS